jgi:hypothetical protein
MRRWYFASAAAAFFPCCGWGRSWVSLVVVAVSVTPQSMPMQRPTAGSASVVEAATKEPYQWPRLS